MNATSNFQNRDPHQDQPNTHPKIHRRLEFDDAGRQNSDRPRRIWDGLRRILIRHAGFILAVSCIVGAGCLLLGLIPKWQRSTPPGVVPVFRISGLDRIHARGEFRKSMTAGHPAGRVLRLHAAVVHDPGNPVYSRHLLESVLESNPRSGFVRKFARTTAPWLLELTRTNHSDLELVLEVMWRLDTLEHLPFKDPKPILESHPPATPWIQAAWIALGLPESWRTAVMAAHTHNGQPSMAFDCDSWNRAVSLAVNSVSTNRIEAENAWKALRGMSTSPAFSPGIARLLLAVAPFRNDPHTAKACLDWLDRRGLASPHDHIRFWKTLHAGGLRGTLLDAIMRFSVEPLTPRELKESASAMIAVGAHDLADRYLTRYASEIGGSPEVWELHAQLLQSQGRWEDLRSVASSLRTSRPTRKFGEGMADYFEKLVDAERDRKIQERSNERSERSNMVAANRGR